MREWQNYRRNMMLLSRQCDAIMKLLYRDTPTSTLHVLPKWRISIILACQNCGRSTTQLSPRCDAIMKRLCRNMRTNTSRTVPKWNIFEPSCRHNTTLLVRTLQKRLSRSTTKSWLHCGQNW